MGSLVRAQEGEQIKKEVRYDLFFRLKPLQFRLNEIFGVATFSIRPIKSLVNQVFLRSGCGYNRLFLLIHIF